jgi:FAD/FMN-containing dehydrogenase
LRLILASLIGETGDRMEPTTTLETHADLRARMDGELLEPGDTGYEDARRIHNTMHDRRPALIARCAGAEDVRAAIDHARARGLSLAVRGGGHHVAGYATCDGGLVVDLSPMKGIHMDPKARTVRAQAGLTWGELDGETQAFGLAVTGGRASTTGIAGQTLGSGSGRLERKLGLGLDNLISAEVVTADGQVLRASEDENEDLFWGLRGAGANFGVVTELEYRLHPIGPVVLGGLLLYDGRRSAELLRLYREVMEEAPDELGTEFVLATGQPEPFVPEKLRGRPVVGIIVCYAGPVHEGLEAVRPLREAIAPVADMVEPMPYTAVQQIVDQFMPPGRRAYWKSEAMRELSDDAIDTWVARGSQMSSPFTSLVLEPKGRAIARVPDDAMAIPGRGAAYFYYAFSIWEDPAEDDHQIDWTRRLSRAMEPYVVSGLPLNFTSDRGEARIRSTFGDQKYARLVALKDRYDPDNLFRLNANIRPSGR